MADIVQQKIQECVDTKLDYLDLSQLRHVPWLKRLYLGCNHLTEVDLSGDKKYVHV